MNEIAKQATFYTFDQNNTGGTWRVDDRVTYTVIIEARSAQEADSIAENVGIYFDGCDDGIDCKCCGDRWYRAYGEGDTEPNIYSIHPSEFDDWYIKAGDVYCRVYYLDGLVAEYRKPDSSQLEEN